MRRKNSEKPYGRASKLSSKAKRGRTASCYPAHFGLLLLEPSTAKSVVEVVWPPAHVRKCQNRSLLAGQAVFARQAIRRCSDARKRPDVDGGGTIAQLFDRHIVWRIPEGVDSLHRGKLKH